MNLLTKVDEIKEYFPNHSKFILRTFLILLGCVLELRTVCLYKCKDKVSRITGNFNSTTASHYKLLLRFFSIEQTDQFCESVFILILSLLNVSSEHLSLDRTNWKIGQKNINLLTLGLVWKKCFIPLCWIQLDKRGNSNYEERKALINRFIRLWKKAGREIVGMILIGDREFIGYKWMEFLQKAKMSFIFRLRDNMYVELQTHLSGKHRKSLKYFSKYIEKYGIYALSMELNGFTYTVVMIKNTKYDPQEPYLYFISDLQNARQISEEYLKRWSIECCFKHLKTNGFNLEAMNFKDDKKITLMMAVVAVVYALALREGLLCLLNKTIPIKKYKNGKQYLSISVFRKGMEEIEQIVSNAWELICYVIGIINLNKNSSLNPLTNKEWSKNVQ